MRELTVHVREIHRLGKVRFEILLHRQFHVLHFPGILVGLWPLVHIRWRDERWQPGSGLWPALTKYATFYVTTSLWWDMGRAVGNFLLILLFGAPILRLLRRFQRRFRFEMA